MTKLRLTLGVAVLLLGTVALASLAADPLPGPQEPVPEGQAPQFPSGVDVVTVDVVVLDRDGHPIEGLTADDFVVKDEGRARPITSFDAVSLPESEPGPPPLRSRVSTNVVPAPRPERTFVIVFDNIHMDRDRAIAARRAVEDFMATGLSDGDRVVVVPTSGGAWWTARIPEGREDISAALERLEGERPRVLSPDRISDYEAMMLYMHRDRQVGSEVIRRYYENRVILEPPGHTELYGDLTDLGEGHPLIRIKSAEVYQAAKARRDATFKALERAADSLAGVKGRKSILLVSEGFIQEPNLPEFKAAVSAARRANAVIYFLDARGLTGLPVSADAEYGDPTDTRDLNSQLAESLRESLGAVSVALDTGGFAIKNSNDLARGMRRIDRESRNYYLIGFPITDVPRNGKFRGIEVEVDRPDVKVVARKGYYAPSDEAETPLAANALDPAIRSAIDSPFEADSIPLRIGSYVLGPAGDGETTVLFVAEVDPRGLDFAQKDGRYEDVLGTYLLVSSRDTGETFHQEREVELSLPPALHQQIRERWLPLVRNFKFKPGIYQARFLVRDRSNRVGTVRHEFEVPASDTLRVSTPILTDVLQPAGGGAAAAAPRPIPLARRSFASGTTLYYAFEVYGAASPDGQAAPRVVTGYRVESVDGKVIGTQPDGALAPGLHGELSQMYSLNLTGMAPGDYLIVLKVRDEIAGKTLEAFDPFSVEAGSPRLSTR